MVRTAPFFLALSTILGASSALAASDCDRPDPPLCAYLDDGFQDAQEYTVCRQVMFSYKAKMSGFRACIQTQLDDSLREYKMATDAFDKRPLNIPK